ncbi:MAG: alpha-galactosidase [Proteobacteria bacterium]|nr:alpha-galactosidase [Pseudomonadota bacterium]
MRRTPTSRRRFLQLAGASAAAGSPLAAQAARALAAPSTPGGATLADSRIRLDFDRQLRWRVWQLVSGRPVLMSDWTAPDALRISGRPPAELFAVREQSREAVSTGHGPGTRLRACGSAGAQLEKCLEVELYERHPGIAVARVSYRNTSAAPVHVTGWSQGAVRLLSPAAPTAEPAFWNYCGSTHEDRRDWVRPVGREYAQENFMGMTSSDYGGGIPIADVWRRDGGLAVGHLALVPLEVSLPVSRGAHGVDVALKAVTDRVLAPGERLTTAESFISVHRGDHFATVTQYRELMRERGVSSPPAPDSAFESIWCAWGYERDCTLELIRDTLPKVKELGLGWAVIDDGWQNNVGDWQLDRAKYPRGKADMLELVSTIRAHGLKPRLWVAPLAAAPGSDLLHDHSDMLLLDKEGAPQAVSWWNSFYLCPAYPKTQEYFQAMVRRLVGEWGFDGLKIDGQHLNGVAPCYNPAHRHASPEDSVTHLQDFLYGMYQTAMSTHPEACVELCPCGTAYSYYSFRAFNQAPASDPESSWQVRHKGKTLKGLMGSGASFAGDHVELSDGGDDFASTVGIGAVVSTKFTWPRDPKPKDSFLLTPEREVLWRHWIALYNERLLSKGTYRGELYDIGFDRPETHAIEKDGRLYYAFYAPQFTGEVTLRGLGPGRYRVRDYFAGRDLGEVAAGRDRLPVSFSRFLVIEALPA